MLTRSLVIRAAVLLLAYAVGLGYFLTRALPERAQLQQLDVSRDPIDIYGRMKGRSTLILNQGDKTYRCMGLAPETIEAIDEAQEAGIAQVLVRVGEHPFSWQRLVGRSSQDLRVLELTIDGAEIIRYEESVELVALLRRQGILSLSLFTLAVAVAWLFPRRKAAPVTEEKVRGESPQPAQ